MPVIHCLLIVALLKTLHIENFRAIERLDLSFDYDDEEGGLAVLAGDNGCGKTSVLEAILLLTGNYHKAIGSGGEQAIRFGATRTTLQAEMTSGETTRLEYSLRSSESLFQQFRRDVLYFPANRVQDLDRRNLERRLINVYNRSARAHLPVDESPFTRLQEALIPFLGREWMMDVLYKGSQPDSEAMLIFRDFDLPLAVDTVDGARQMARQNGRGRIFTLEQLSSGQIGLFSLLGPLLFDIEGEPPLVLIDEPEQHLHISWQKQLLPAMRHLSPRSQIIVATHSLEILHSAMSYERHLLPRPQQPLLPLRDAGE
ncbi:MAG: AAA family ATPase [Polyangiaceae bacterium]|jgi:predicted ATPase|nr:AAA family ATPase [Polyangiaceae bacterium]